MSRRALILCAAAALLVASCAERPEAEVAFGDGVAFVPMVADALDDVGRGNDLAVDAEGRPFISYFGFPAEEGTVTATRPINSAFLPAVQLTTVTDGIFVRGAVAQVQDVPAPAYVVPFGPDTVESLEGLGPADAAGTAIADGDDGTIHVAWSGTDGVWYASGTESFSVEQVAPADATLGPPSIAVDDGGAPWISYQASTAVGTEVRVATPGADAWEVDVAAVAGPCDACGAAPVAVVGGDPLVVFTDEATGDLVQATPAGARWADAVGVTGLDASGLAMTSDGDTAVLSAYAGGAVTVATSDGGGSWSSSDVAQADPGDGGGEDAPDPTTDVAFDDEGVVYVAWQDADGVSMASAADGTAFEQLETPGAEAGVTPSIGASPDGATVYLSWFDPTTQDLRLGVLGETGDLVLANPSPIPPPEAGGGGGEAGCGEDGVLVLDIVAENTAFDPTCLVGPAAEPFEINFDNRDDVNATGPHNVAIYTEQGGDDLFVGELINGPEQVTYPVDPIDAGEYFFQCDVHPTMVGTFVAVEGGGAGGGGGGAGGGGGGNEEGDVQTEGGQDTTQ
ncbi:MAG TPA: cupredoxin domain-containing protein [Actinomycetota bacterium]